jgi:hypothetical protein
MAGDAWGDTNHQAVLTAIITMIINRRSITANICMALINFQALS